MIIIILPEILKVDQLENIEILTSKDQDLPLHIAPKSYDGAL